MILKCAIVDDEPLALDLMESYVNRTPFLSLCGKYSSAIMAMEGIRDNEPDLLFLDIQMPELNGMEFSRMINRNIKVIFTTAFEQYAIEGFKVNALDYLLKPISYNDFLNAAQRGLEWFGADRSVHHNGDKEKKFIYVKSEYKLVQIMLDDILYIEGLKDYLKIYLADGQKPVTTLMSMKSMEEALPYPQFMRVHRSFIVQTKKIQIIDKGQIVFGKTRITISESYKNDISEYLNKYIL